MLKKRRYKTYYEPICFLIILTWICGCRVLVRDLYATKVVTAFSCVFCSISSDGVDCVAEIEGGYRVLHADLIHSFIPSLIRSFHVHFILDFIAAFDSIRVIYHPINHALVAFHFHSSTHAFVRSFIRSFAWIWWFASDLHSCIRSFGRSYAMLFNLFILSFFISFANSFILSVVHRIIIIITDVIIVTAPGAQ